MPGTSGCVFILLLMETVGLKRPLEQPDTLSASVP